jgi:uncharacterized protein
LKDTNPFLKSSATFGDFLNAIFDEWLEHDLGRVCVQHFDTALAAWMGLAPGLCVHEQTCGKILVLEFNGDLYACDHFLTPENLLGNILHSDLGQMTASVQQISFDQGKPYLPQACRDCRYLFVCNGGCPKDRLTGPDEDGPRLNYLCESYKAFFGHIDSPMKRMAALVKTRARNPV